jgi:predicted ATP-binding protein involved in virulence
MRLNRLIIKNYKKIDYLEIDFPKPLMPHDPDVFILGSRNGGGKTSVLECCALLVLEGIMPWSSDGFSIIGKNQELDIANSLIKAGTEKAVITGYFEKDSESNIDRCSVSLTINKEGFQKAEIEGNKSLFEIKVLTNPLIFGQLINLINDILGFSSNSFVTAPLIFLNSYRKTEKANPEVGMMVDRKTFYNSKNSESMQMHITNLLFKTQVLSAFIKTNQLIDFGASDPESAANTIEKLNQITKRYSGGKIGVLARSDNTFEIRIKHDGGQKSFPFDGLSSGQKEIITTLFLIWNNTQHQPSIVLIDEPELHLNSEWHRDFVMQLCKLAPQNQYILATHSEEIFRSVDQEYRAILVPDDGDES